jgi:hypothetical protein
MSVTVWVFAGILQAGPVKIRSCIIVVTFIVVNGRRIVITIYRNPLHASKSQRKNLVGWPAMVTTGRGPLPEAVI